MVNINQSTGWFQSAAGVVEFEKITTLEERTLFIQAFLEKATNESKTYFYNHERMDMKKISFCFALFLADAIHRSNFPYAKYPALLDPTQNPFIAYWQGEGHYGKAGWSSFYNAFTRVLIEENKKLPQNRNGKFYQALKAEAVKQQAEEYFDQVVQLLPDTTVFDLDPTLQPIQLKNMWLFGNK